MPLQGPVTAPLKSNDLFSKISHYVKPVALPLLLAVTPTLYHYSNNVEKLTLASLYRMLVFNVILAVLTYIVCLFFAKFQALRAANAAFIFLIFFNVYGLLYRYLLALDIIRVKHYTLLPLILLLTVYGMGFLARRKDALQTSLWKYLFFVVSFLVLFNMVKIAPAEMEKWSRDATTASLDGQTLVSTGKKSPDIYYIIMDEFEGFQGMREYWHYQGVDEFVRFLKGHDFFVAEASYASSTDTLHQMASRLNYEDYPIQEKDVQLYFDLIADNRVMRFLKSRGYTTVVFDETKMGYTSAKSIQADHLYEYGSTSIPQGEVGTYGFAFDEFGELVVDNTMLYAISQNYKSNNPLISQHTNMISFTVDNIAKKDIRSPKFVYVHLLLPHAPFIYNENGQIVDSNHFTDWNYYIDNYKFSVKVAEQMVNNILQFSDPGNPPVIIIQSDHGARNHLAHVEGSKVLENYPEKYKSLIMYALYLPGYDISSLPQDINPTTTFPIVFDYLFDAGITVQK
jgi:hypothetical protein